jgi:hypothetical protein
MDIDEDTCITEWTDREISPPIPRSRRRTDSVSLLLPIPSLRNTLTPPDHDTSVAIDTLASTNESANSNGLAPTAAPSYSPEEFNIRRRRQARSRRSIGDMKGGRRYDSPTLLLPIPSLREEFTISEEGSGMNNQSAPAHEDSSHPETEQSAPFESSPFSVSKTSPPIDGQPSYAPVIHPSLKSRTSLVAEEKIALVKHVLLHTTDVSFEHGEVDVEHGIKPEHSALRDSCNKSYLSESDELTNHSLNRPLAEAYREPVKLNGRTVLHSIHEERQNFDEVNRLRDQVEQLSVENQSLNGRLQKFRHDYEERITPFRDVFEQNAKLKEENKKLLLLKAENNILQSQNKEITEGIAMLEGQTMLALQKALERQKTLEEERDQAKRQVAELERQIQKLSAT